MRSRHVLVLALLGAFACGKDDNSSDTDRASQDLQKAQAAVSQHSKSLVESQEAIEEKKRTLLREQEQLAREQQALVDRQKLLEKQQIDLGAAKEGLVVARAAYAAAVKERFAKLDASLATLSTRTDARSKDAVTGLKARRDQLSVKLAALTDTADAGWSEYTSDVDTTFDAIEHDLQEAVK